MIACLAGDLFIFVGETRQTIYIWDFKKNLWASFDTSLHVNDEIGHVGLLHMTFFRTVDNRFGNRSCTMTGKLSALVAALQQFVILSNPMAATMANDSIFNIPMSQIPFNFPLNSRGVRFAVITRTNTHYWEQVVSRTFPLTFDALDRDYVSHRIEFLTFSTVSLDNSQPSYVQTTYNTDTDNFHSCCQIKQRYCDSKIIRTWVQTNRADIIQTSFPPLTCPPPAPTSRVTKIVIPSAISSVSLQASNTIATGRLLDYSFDPLSGRLCSIEKRNGGYGYETNVVISDYLLHP